MSMDYNQKLQEEIQQIPPEYLPELVDLVHTFSEKVNAKRSGQRGRVADLYKGQIRMSEDFDEPLDEAFWLGDGEI